MYATTPTAHDVSALRGQLTGAVTVPGDAAWDDARRAFNLAADQRPVAVAEPATTADIVAIVHFARARGLRVAPQGTGHGAVPLAPRLRDAILVKTHRMRAVEIDPDRRRVRAQAGALWGDVAGPAAEHGLAGLAGTALGVGVVGYALGGGIGWLARKHGFAAHSITAIQLVKADGRLAVVDRDHEPDLFWALRGGGGSFGIVTAIELELHPVGELYAGLLGFPIERAAEVLTAWREWIEDVPDEVTSLGRILHVPDTPQAPAHLRGRSLALVEAVYLGDMAGGRELLAPLRALGPELDTFAMVGPDGLAALHMDPPAPVPGRGEGFLLDALPPDAVEALVGAAVKPLVSVEVRHLGGALARPREDHGAVGTVDAAFSLSAVGTAPDPDSAAVVVDRLDALQAGLERWASDRRLLTLVERTTPAAHSREAYRRLRAVKTLVDPDGTIQANHPVPAID